MFVGLFGRSMNQWTAGIKNTRWCFVWGLLFANLWLIFPKLAIKYVVATKKRSKTYLFSLNNVVPDCVFDVELSNKLLKLLFVFICDLCTSLAFHSMKRCKFDIITIELLKQFSTNNWNRFNITVVFISNR